MGLAAMYRGNNREAEPLLRAAVRAEPNDLTTHNNLALFLIQLNDTRSDEV